MYLAPKAANKHKRVRYLVSDSVYIALMQCLSYFFKMGAMPLAILNPKVHEPIYRLAWYLYEVVTVKPEERSFKSVKLPVYVKHGVLKISHGQMFDKQFADSVSTLAKRGVGILHNNFITERYQRAKNFSEEDVFSPTNTGVNFCRRVAVMESLINGKIPFMTLESLTQFTELLYERITGGTMTLDHNPLPQSLDADIIHLFTHVSTALKSRLTVKSVELMPPDCTCYTKCYGPTYGYKRITKFMNDLEHTSFATRICGLCRLSLTVKNTTSAKPKRYISPENPGISTCSHDGCSTGFISRTNICNREFDDVYSIAHRSFITNSLPITDALYKNRVSTAKGRVYMNCVSGSRNCYGCAVKSINSAKQKRFTPDFYNLKQWWRCSACKNMDVYDPENHAYFTEDMQRKSCIGLFYHRLPSKPTMQDVETEAASMCMNCRVAVMCRHAQDGLTNRMVDVKERAVTAKQKLLDLTEEEKLEMDQAQLEALEAASEGNVYGLLNQLKLLTMLQNYVVNNTPEWNLQPRV